MPHVRLTGLILFITTIFLALAAAATQTAVIRFKRPGYQPPAGNSVPPAQGQGAVPDSGASESGGTQPGVPVTGMPLPSPSFPGVPASGEAKPAETSSTPALQFIAVPVIFPLMASGLLGLLLWFVPATLSLGSGSAKRRRRRR